MRNKGRFQAGSLHPFKRASGELTEKDSNRFWGKVTYSADTTVCWEWQAYRGPKGYGQFGIGRNRLESSHRVAWALFHDGVFPEQCVLHRCDNPPCCNPHHLFLGDRSDNNQDMRDKGRGKHLHLPRKAGEEHAMALLREQDVVDIRGLVCGGASQTELSKAYGVSVPTINAVVWGRNWPEAGGPIKGRDYKVRKGNG